MNKPLKFLFVFLSILGGILSVSAQDVYITVPAHSLFNRSEFLQVKSVMNTQGHNKWRPSGVNPRIRSIVDGRFKHTSLPNTFLPSSVLHWQLNNIGGSPAPFRNQDRLPEYQYFTPTYQAWYFPHSTAGFFNAGDIAFSFKIPSSEMANNTFYAGDYKIEVEQDYYRGSENHSNFSPERFTTYLSIPEAIEWILFSDSKLYEVSSLNQYRASNSLTKIDLGPMEIGHTIDFDLYARTGSSSVKFTSLNGKTRSIDVDLINLESNNPKIANLPLNRNWTKHSISGDFKVEPGNRTSFELQLAINREDFKTHFFEAGTYNLSIKLDAKGTEQFINATKVIDLTIIVPALSEITLLGGDGEVNFVFNNMVQYNEGQSKTIPNQLRVSNNESYELYVKSSAKHFNSNGIQTDIKASILEVGVEGNPRKVKLSTNSKKIIKDGIPSMDENLNMVYTISPSAARSLIPKDKKSYNISVVYSFTAI